MRNVDIKVSFNGQIRHVPSNGSFAAFCDQITRAFGIEKFVLKYKDSDGDLITVSTDMELQHADTGAVSFEVFPSVPLCPVVQPSNTVARQYVVQPSSPVVHQHAVQPPQHYVQYPVHPSSPVVPPASPLVQQFVLHPPSPVVPQSLVLQQPASPANNGIDFKDKAVRKNYKKTHSREEWKALKAARKAEKQQRKAAKTPHGNGNAPVPFPNSVVACDPTKRVLTPGMQFTQTWRVRNEGIYAWPAGMMILYTPYHKQPAMPFTGPNFMVIDRPLASFEEAQLTFNFTAPQAPGKYVGVWRLSTPDQWVFGKKIKLVVKVPAPENAERMLQKAKRKAKLTEDEKRALKQAKKNAKYAAKQGYWEAKEAKGAAKLEKREAKRKAAEAYHARKEAAKATTMQR